MGSSMKSNLKQLNDDLCRFEVIVGMMDHADANGFDISKYGMGGICAILDDIRGGIQDVYNMLSRQYESEPSTDTSTLAGRDATEDDLQKAVDEYGDRYQGAINIFTTAVDHMSHKHAELEARIEELEKAAEGVPA